MTAFGVLAPGANYGADNYGINPSRDPDALLQAVNALLARGGTVNVDTPGTYTVSGTILIPSNTRLVCGPGVRWKLKDGLTNTPLLSNSDPTNGNSNIEVIGGMWDGNGPNQIRTDGSTFSAFCLIFQRVTDLRVSDIRLINPRAWGLTLAVCSKFSIARVWFDYTSKLVNQDGLHVTGGSFDGVIQDIYGTTGDDMVALVSEDYGVYEFATPKGPIDNITIEGITADLTLGTYRHFRILSTVAYPIKNVSASAIKGKYQLSSVLLSSITGATADTQNITISDVEVQQLNTTSTEPSILVSQLVDDLTLRDIKRLCPAGETPQPLFRTSAVIRHLVVDGVHIRDQTTAGASWFLFNSASGSLQYAQFSNIKIWSNQGTATGAVFEIASPYSWNRVQINGVMCEKIRYLVLAGGNVTRSIQVENVSMDNNNNPAIFQNGAFTLPLLQISNMYLQGTQGGANGCIRFSGLTGTCIVGAVNCVFENGANADLTRAAAEAIRVQSNCLRVDDAILTPINGDTILDFSNSNAPTRYAAGAWGVM